MHVYMYMYLEIPNLEGNSENNDFLAMDFMCKKVMKPK